MSNQSGDETAILALIHRAREIAAMLGITANTARTHLDRIYDKTGVRTQPALVRALFSVAAPV
jgi:DNA-binding CsgD family transcriptional regulator